MQYRLYILRCADGSLYTGIATDIERRLSEHREGKRGAKYLRGRMPAQLVFECEAGPRGDAQRLEHQVKRLDRRAKEALIAGSLAPDWLPKPGAFQASGVSNG